MKLVKNDRGSILVSTFGLLLFISFLITAATHVIKNQVVQYNLIRHTYEAKAMIEMTKHLLITENDDSIKSGRVTFTNGQVTVQQASEKSYHLEAVLDNKYRSRSIFVLPDLETEDLELIDEDTYSDE